MKNCLCDMQHPVTIRLGDIREASKLFSETTRQINESKKEIKMSENKKPEIGKGYYIRCVTYHYAGVLVSETDQHYVLNKAAWIAFVLFSTK